METLTSPETTPTLLRMRDFNMGHYPDTKDPPWILNEIWMSDHPDLCEEAKTVISRLQPGQEQFLFLGEFETLPLEIRAYRHSPDNLDFSLRAFPRTL